MEYGRRTWQTGDFGAVDPLGGTWPKRVYRICPVCGAGMAELDRLAKGDTLYVWFACVRHGCTGQSLGQKSLRMPRS